MAIFPASDFLKQRKIGILIRELNFYCFCGFGDGWERYQLRKNFKFIYDKLEFVSLDSHL